ncbi:hypothetical protein PENTCL1PPCAC_13160, partial [Pristionchus entomophagus]
NATRYLMMADMFDIKEQVENWLLSTDLIFIHRKLLLATEYNMEVLKCLYKYKNDGAKRREMVRSSEYAEFPAQLVKDLFSHIHG